MQYKGNGSAALEEERRGCFVAVKHHTGKRLILSRTRHYRGRSRVRSRFLEEMGCLSDHGADTAARRIG